MKVAVVGASGFVGRRLLPALEQRGHEVVALTRRPNDYRGVGSPRFADLGDCRSLIDALAGAQVAYLLAHSLGSHSFQEREAEHAYALRDAAEAVGLETVVFLGGLGRATDGLSPHLQSRRDVEDILRTGSVEVTVLRAGIILGAGSAAWEMLRQLGETLPVTISDSRALTLHQPIAASDAIGYLVDVIDAKHCKGRTLEIGCADVLSYRDMAERFANLTGRTRPRIHVPWLPNVVAAAAVDLFTDVDGQTAQDLLESMSTEAVVTDTTVHDLLPRKVLGFDDAVRIALTESMPRTRWTAARALLKTVVSGKFIGWPLRKHYS